MLTDQIRVGPYDIETNESMRGTLVNIVMNIQEKMIDRMLRDLKREYPRESREDDVRLNRITPWELVATAGTWEFTIKFRSITNLIMYCPESSLEYDYFDEFYSKIKEKLDYALQECK